MAKKTSNQQVDDSLREYLKIDYFLPKHHNHNNGTTGCDLIATSKSTGEKLYIEIEGRDSRGSVNERNFHRSFFRVLSRMKEQSYNKNSSRLIIALPIGFEAGSKARRENLGLAWDIIGVSFPKLEIWLVDTNTNQVKEMKWNDFGR